MTADESIAALKELLLAKTEGLLALIHEKDGRYADMVDMKIEACFDRLKEKDALYTDRDNSRRTAVDAALAAAKTLNDATFAASEKAIGKSDQNAEKWRENANEWRQAMMDREIKFAARTETENEFKSIRSELASLKESRAAHVGKTEGISTTGAVIMGAVALIGALVGIAGVIYGTLR